MDRGSEASPPRTSSLTFPSCSTPSSAKQIAFEKERIAKFDPRLVVSDSRLSSVIGAKATGHPVITMLNQSKVTFPPRFRGNRQGRFYERVAGDVLGLLWSLSDQVLMTDLPPPYTIGEANLQGTPTVRIVRFVGFTSPRPELDGDRLAAARSKLDIDSRPLVFCQVSGPDATKGRFVGFSSPLCRRPLEAVQRRGLTRSPGRFPRTQTPRPPMGVGSTNGVPSRTSSSPSRTFWWPVQGTGP